MMLIEKNDVYLIPLLICFGCDAVSEKENGESTSQEEEQHVMTGIEVFLLNKHFLFESSEEWVPIDGTDINIAFVMNEMGGLDLLLSGGCNELRGWATFDSQATMLIDEMTGIDQTCDWDVMTQDEWLMTFFTNTPTLLMPGGGYLQMTGETATLIFLQSEP